MRIVKFIRTYLDQLWERRFSDTKVEQLQKLYVGKGRGGSIICYRRKLRKGYIFLGCTVLLLLPLTVLLGRGNGQITGQNEIRRQDPGGTADTVKLEASIAGNKQEIEVAVSPRSYTAEELQAQFSLAKQYIQKAYLGTNDSSEHITHNLRLDITVPDSAVCIEWQLDAMHLIEADGTIHWELIEDETAVEIVAILTYGEERQELPLALTLYPPRRSGEEQLWLDWEKQQRELAEQTKTDAFMKLPKEIAGQIVTYHEPRKPLWLYLLFAGGIGVLMIPLILDSRMRQGLRRREKELVLDYPEILERYILLIGAGMTIKGAWMRIASEYLSMRDRRKRSYRFVYEEMLVTMREMESGMSEGRAYELFGRRIGILSYMRFSTLLVQNLRKGSDDLLRLLEYEAVDAFRERKEQAKDLGEEAGTKLLMPMMLMLMIVLVMIVYAAFRSM